MKSCATFSTNKMQKIILAFSRARIWLIQVFIGSFRYSSSFWLAAVCTLGLLYDNWWTALNVSINTISCITDMTVYNLTSVLSVAVWSSPRFWSGFPREERKIYGLSGRLLSFSARVRPLPLHNLQTIPKWQRQGRKVEINQDNTYLLHHSVGAVPNLNNEWKTSGDLENK